MNQWQFVIAAYAVMLLATAALFAWTYTSMRHAETAADALKRRD